MLNELTNSLINHYFILYSSCSDTLTAKGRSNNQVLWVLWLMQDAKWILSVIIAQKAAGGRLQKLHQLMTYRLYLQNLQFFFMHGFRRAVD